MSGFDRIHSEHIEAANIPEFINVYTVYRNLVSLLMAH